MSVTGCLINVLESTTDLCQAAAPCCAGHLEVERLLPQRQGPEGRAGEDSRGLSILTNMMVSYSYVSQKGICIYIYSDYIYIHIYICIYVFYTHIHRECVYVHVYIYIERFSIRYPTCTLK